MQIYQFDLQQLQDVADIVKAQVVAAICSDGLIDKDTADDWAAHHMIALTEKSIWRTISDLWQKSPASTDGNLFVRVAGDWKPKEAHSTARGE